MQTNTRDFSDFSCDVTYCRELGQVLQDTKVSDLPGVESQNLVTFDSKARLRDCFHKLIEHNIHSAPVFDAEKGAYIGLLDWKDFSSYAIAVLKLSEQDAETKGEELLKKQDAESLSDFSKHNHFFPIFKDSSLLTVLSGFSRYGVHRRPVFNTDSVATTVIAMVSQSTIVQWLAQRRKDLKALDERRILQVVEEEQNKKIKKLSFVVSVGPHAKMLDVLTLMVKRNLTGVAVINTTGTLIGNISVSDLKYLVEDLLDNMLLTVSEFLEKVPRRSLVTVPSTASLGDVIEKLAVEGTYRCYVVEKDMYPVAVITLSDIISAVLLMASEGGKDIS
jgi:CBS domain-containing protein